MNTKLNTIFKSSILALTVLVMAFMFSACGSKTNQFKAVNVDTDADYQASNIQDVTEIIEADTSTPTGFRMSMDMTMSMSFPGAEGEPDVNVEVSMSLNALLKIVSDTDDEQVIKFAGEIKTLDQTTGKTIKATMYQTITYDKVNELYDYVMLTNDPEGKYKVVMEDMSQTDLEDPSMPGVMFSTDDLLNSIRPNLEVLNSATSIKTATENNVTKIEVVSPVEGIEGVESSTSYLIYKDGKFSQCVIDSLSLGLFTVSMSVEVWDGEIKFPNADDYAEMPEITE